MSINDYDDPNFFSDANLNNRRYYDPVEKQWKGTAPASLRDFGPGFNEDPEHARKHSYSYRQALAMRGGQHFIPDESAFAPTPPQQSYAPQPQTANDPVEALADLVLARLEQKLRER